MIPKHREPTHPGEMLLKEFLKQMKLTQLEAADKIGILLNRLNELIRGKRSVTTEKRHAEGMLNGLSKLSARRQAP